MLLSTHRKARMVPLVVYVCVGVGVGIGVLSLLGDLVNLALDNDFIILVFGYVQTYTFHNLHHTQIRWGVLAEINNTQNRRHFSLGTLKLNFQVGICTPFAGSEVSSGSIVLHLMQNTTRFIKPAIPIL